MFKQSKPIKSEITVWSDHAVSVLKNCFDITNWDVFRDLWTDIDQFTDTVSEYIRFCEGVCLPRKIKTIYPNNKSWCTADVREKNQI